MMYSSVAFALAIVMSLTMSASADPCAGYTLLECRVGCIQQGYHTGDCNGDQCACSSKLEVPTPCSGYITDAACDSACKSGNYREGICTGATCTCKGTAPQICGGYTSAECQAACTAKGHQTGECGLLQCSCKSVSVQVGQVASG